MLLVDRGALGGVHLLDLTDQMLLHLAHTHDAQHVVGVEGASGELLSSLHPCTIANDDVPATEVELQTCAAWQGVLHVLLTVITHEDEFATGVGLLQANDTGGLGDRRLALGGTGLEELDDTCLLYTSPSPRD